MPALHSAVGYCVLLLIAWACGTRRGGVPVRILVIAAVMQVGFAALVLHTGLRHQVFALIGGLTDLLRETALKANESLLFAGLSNPGFTAAYGGRSPSKSPPFSCSSHRFPGSCTTTGFCRG